MSARREQRQAQRKAWANEILDRVRAGDKTPTRTEITRALGITGDLARGRPA